MLIQNRKRRYDDDKRQITEDDPQVLEKGFEALYDLKSDIGFIKKHVS